MVDKSSKKYLRKQATQDDIIHKDDHAIFMKPGAPLDIKKQNLRTGSSACRNYTIPSSLKGEGSGHSPATSARL